MAQVDFAGMYSDGIYIYRVITLCFNGKVMICDDQIWQRNPNTEEKRRRYAVRNGVG